MRSALAVAVLAVVALAPSAAGRADERLAIRPGVGIGPLNLGMSGQEVRRALGPPRAVVERRVVRGQPYVELEWNLGDWYVGLLGRPGHRRAVMIGTALFRHRTPEGLGVGTDENRLWRELRGRLHERWCRPSTHWYVREGRGETIYQPIWQRPPKQMVVGRVQVRMRPALGCAV
jgi:hypothetical protein